MDIPGTTILLLVVAGFAAGWIDAVVGGGGLVQLPALLLVPGISPVQALATNKLAGIMGTSVSAITYYRRVGPDLRTALPMALAALAGAVGGAALASRIPAGFIFSNAPAPIALRLDPYHCGFRDFAEGS